MASFNLLLLPGDGIGPEVANEVKKVTAFLDSAGIAKFETETDLVGGSAYDAHGVAITDAAMALAQASDAVLFGAVGGPKWADVPYHARPEAGLLRLRKDMQLFANLRPAVCYPALADASSLKREIVEGLDILIVRELTGGVYFGEPKEIVTLENGEKRAVDTQVYTTHEIERIARVAFDLAKVRRKKVTSSEKHNVMRSGGCGRKWSRKSARPSTRISSWSITSPMPAACSSCAGPSSMTSSSATTSSATCSRMWRRCSRARLACCPRPRSARRMRKTGKRKALYEPVHGSAPDIAGKGLANPIAMIGSFAMALRYSCGLSEAADLVDKAIADVLATGIRTRDIAPKGVNAVGTAEMGDAIVAALKRLT